MSYFLFKLIPPRPTFAQDMTQGEAETMKRHVAYGQHHLEAGRVLVFGPVADPAGSWGLGVVVADSEDDAIALASTDPAVTSKMCAFEVFAMPGARARS